MIRSIEQEAAKRIVRDAMLDAQARQALYADQTRTPSDLKVGDSVLVYRDFLLTPEARGVTVQLTSVVILGISNDPCHNAFLYT